MLPPRELADLYRTSRLVYFPMATVGGGERALLEARFSLVLKLAYFS